MRIGAASGLLFGAIVVATSAQAQQWTVVGPGDDRCQAWTVARTVPITNDNLRDNAARVNWVAGYLSSEAWYGHRDLLRGVGSADIIAWLDRHCAAHPVHRIRQAADAFAFTLTRSRQPMS